MHSNGDSDEDSQSGWGSSDKDTAGNKDEHEPKQPWKSLKRSASEADIIQSVCDGEHDMFDPVASVSQTTDILSQWTEILCEKVFFKSDSRQPSCC